MMDVQPSLSPFNPSLSYSLLVDDVFISDSHEALTGFSDDDDNFTKRDVPQQLQTLEEPLARDYNDNLLTKEVDVIHDLDLGADMVEGETVEEIIVFDPRISDWKEETRMNGKMELLQDVKENISYYLSVDCQTIDSEAKTLLLTSLCSSNNPTHSQSCTTHPCGGSSHSSTTSPTQSSSPGPSSPMLPPCRVCGEKASGFHYGANTCEACKGFFRRSLQRKQSYKCLGSNNCDISSGRRNVCAACRYRKCLSLGMSKTAIKTGRYTHAKKTKDIQEVKRLQRQHRLMSWKEERGGSPGGKVSDDAGSEVVDEEVAEGIIERIMKTHRHQTPHTPEFFEKLPRKEDEYLLRRKLKQKVFGPLRPISHDEYTNIYHCTGIDVDGRRAMLEHMLPCIERAVKRFVTFAKAIPGFKELPLEDQIKLIKGSRFEAWLISSYRAFNPDHLLYTHYCGSTVHLDGMSRLYDESFLKDVFRMVSRIKKLDLTEEEECMVKAILILFKDRCTLQAPDQAESCQTKLVKTLIHLHQRRRPKDRIFFGKISAILTEMRTLTDLHTIQENKIQVEWATDIRIPPLLYELFYV